MAETTEILQRVTRIETKLDSALAVDRDHERRVRNLEKRQWFLSGVGAVIGAVLTKIGFGGHIG